MQVKNVSSTNVIKLQEPILTTGAKKHVDTTKNEKHNGQTDELIDGRMDTAAYKGVC